MRPRAADDVETIRARLQELRKEREEAIAGEPVQPPCDTEQDTQDYACGFAVPTPYCLHPQVMGLKPGGCALYPGCGCQRTRERAFDAAFAPSYYAEWLKHGMLRPEPGEFTDGA
jgi:hypothetical protein